MAYTPASGTLSSLVINGLTLNTNNTNWVDDCNIMNAPAFGQNGYMRRCVGLKTMSLTTDGIWDLSLNPMAGGIKTGAYVSAATYINNTINASCSTCYVQHFEVTSDADNMQTYNIVLLSDGQFNDFSGSAA